MVLTFPSLRPPDQTNLASVADADLARRSAQYSRFVGILAVILVTPSILAAALVLLVDPYYVAGSPDIAGLNAVRPLYEGQVLAAKPYQVRRLKPQAVALGSSRVEVGIDPRHPGWAGQPVFNFGVPASTSYEIMLAFLHAQQVAPLKQAVVGLDFFGFNAFFSRGRQMYEARFGFGDMPEFADFLEAELARRTRTPSPASPDAKQDAWPADWDEPGYLQLYPDAANEVHAGKYASGYQHYLARGVWEGRFGGSIPATWNDADYLERNAAARARVAMGEFRVGFLHYVAAGRDQGLTGGMPAADASEYLRWWSPAFNRALFLAGDVSRLLFSTTSVRDSLLTVVHQRRPATFNGDGMRVWEGQDAELQRLGGAARIVRAILTGFQWYLWLPPPRFMYCFTSLDTGATMFDPYRFMLRRAYAEGTDLRLYTTPLHAGVRDLMGKLGLGERYEFWLAELARINEEEAARAGRPALPIWDFSDANSITTETIPASDDLRPMRWFWEISHYRKVTGDLILDRVLGYADPARPLPSDFGVRLTGSTMDSHLARSRQAHEAWVAREAELAAQITRAVGSPSVESRQPQATCW